MTTRLAIEIFGLVLLTKGLLLPILAAGDASAVNIDDGLLPFQLAAGALYLTAGIGLCISPPKTLTALNKPWPIWCTIFVATASTFWSVSPDLTVRRSIALFGTTLFGFWIGRDRTMKELQSIVTLTMWVVTVASLFFLFFIPNLGYHEGLHEGDWRGAFLHKNAFGQFMTLAALCFAFSTIRRPLHLLGLATAILMVVGSRSITAWVLAPVILIVTPLMRRALTPLRLASLGALVVVCTVISADLNWDAVANAVGRDATLTGRIPLWMTLIEDIAARPFLGYGFGAYWLGDAGASPSQWAALGWSDSPRHAHSAFLDVLLDVGTVGLIFLIVTLCRTFLRTVESARRGSREYAWASGVVLLIVLFSITGGEMLAQNSVPWVLLVAITTRVTLDRTAKETRDRQPAWQGRAA
jgi:exopolysaccharide production protein ExoQ